MTATIADQRARLAALLDTPAPVQHKAIAAEATITREGTFVALVASFDTVDRVGDIIRPGAFATSLERWRQSGKRIPIVWSHQSDDPTLVVGSADPAEAYESPEGLVLAGRLNVDNSAAANHVFDLLMKADVDSWSFGYKLVRDRRLRDGTTELLELDLIEAGPTATPANIAARTLSVKGLEPSRREPPEPPSHVEVERRLIEAGIISRPLADVYENARLDMLRVLGFGNGDEREKALTDAGLRRRCAALGIPATRTYRASQAELRKAHDDLRLEGLMAGITRAPTPEPGPVVPSDAELRQHAKSLGLSTPPSPMRRAAEAVRDEFLALMLAADVAQTPARPPSREEADLKRRSRETMLDIRVGTRN